VDRSAGSRRRVRPVRSLPPRASGATLCRANRQRMLNIGAAKKRTFRTTLLFSAVLKAHRNPKKSQIITLSGLGI
jgi:hypothetical protein